MRHRWRYLARLVSLAVLAPLALSAGPVAHADGPVDLGGGSGIVIDGHAFCTLTAIGHDVAGKLIGFTSATAGTLGVMVAGNDGLDYAVIEFDPQKVRPVNTVNGFSIFGIGPDEDPGTILNQVCGQPGDSGAPVTVNNRLVGMIHGAFTEDLPTCVVKFVPLHTPAVTVSINTVLADIATKNRPGTGFVPVA
ncbi:MAG: peptidase [Mycobacterium sp.]|nr:peptidase [Mycobacterium sp.]